MLKKLFDDILQENLMAEYSRETAFKFFEDIHSEYKEKKLSNIVEVTSRKFSMSIKGKRPPEKRKLRWNISCAETEPSGGSGARTTRNSPRT